MDTDKAISAKEWLKRFFFGGLLILIVASIALLVGIIGFAIGNSRSQGPSKLIEEVYWTPHHGIVVSNLDEEICLVLFKGNGTAYNHKSCAGREEVLNLGVSVYAQPGVNPMIGDRYEVRHFQDYGLKNGIILGPMPLSDHQEPHE